MEGVSWIDRQPSDWLASNGRWYPARTYPNGWSSSALPPAPGHGGANSVMQKYANAAAGAMGLGSSGSTSTSSAPYEPVYQSSDSDWDDPDVARPRPTPTPTPTPTPGFSVARSGRSVADATVTSQRTYANRVGPAAPPPPAIASPAPPGRVRPDAPAASTGAVPGREPEFPPPPATPTPSVPAKTPAVPAAPPKTEFEVIAGDLGSVLGSARKRIEKALNDSFEG